MKIVNIFSYITLLLGFFFIGLIFYWYSYPYHEFYFETPYFPVLNKVVHRGDTVSYTSKYCKNFDHPIVVSRTFENDLIFVTPSIVNNRPQGCHVLQIEVPIPKELPIGKYKLVNVFRYEPNPIRTITVIQDTEEFEVIE